MSYLLNALLFLLDIVFDAVLVLFVLRILAEACRADFYNPFSQFLYRYTNPVLSPFRRVLPPVRRINLAALLLVLLVIALKRGLMTLLLGHWPNPLGLTLLSIAELIDFLLLTYIVLVFGWSLLSMFQPDPRHPLQRFAEALVAPLLQPLRGKLVLGMIDFSPTVVIIGLVLARMLIVAPLYNFSAGLLGQG